MFSDVYAFLSKKIATFKKSYEIGIKKVSFSSEENYSLKKEKISVTVQHVGGKKDKLVPGGTSFCIRKSWILTG